jgi:EmrB/QacA subfamily drug resistance transporter
MARSELGGPARAAAVVGLLVTLLLAALDSTVVGTAMPRILAELGGLDRYTWVTTAYLLASTVTVPVAGKLSDLYGRKRVLLIGVGAFVATSALCGAASDLGQLIAFRALQGIGGGIVTAAVFAAVPELFSPAARARLVGLFTGTYGLAAIVGPLLGGVLTDALGWRSVFAVNLPLGALAAAVLVVAYPARAAAVEARPSVDYAGALTLVGGVGLILLALSVGGRELAWTSPALVGLVAVGALLLALFARVEARASDPIIPLGLLRSRSVGLPTLGMGLMSVGLFAATLFVPLFAQGVTGHSASRSGSLLAPFTVAFVAASILVGQLIARVGRYRLAGVGGLGLAAVGLALLATMGPGTGDGELVRNLVLTGLGVGGALSAFAIANQSAVPMQHVGVATALGAFARAVGGTFGSAGLGAVLVGRLDVLPGAAPRPEALAVALQGTFVAAALVAAAGVVVALFVAEVPLRRSAPAPRAADAATRATSEPVGVAAD